MMTEEDPVFRTRATVVEGDRLITLAIPLRGSDDLGKARL